jgi:hypothetical protein
MQAESSQQMLHIINASSAVRTISLRSVSFLGWNRILDPRLSFDHCPKLSEIRVVDGAIYFPFQRSIGNGPWDFKTQPISVPFMRFTSDCAKFKDDPIAMANQEKWYKTISTFVWPFPQDEICQHITWIARYVPLLTSRSLDAAKFIVTRYIK